MAQEKFPERENLKYYPLLIVCLITLGFYLASYMRIPVIPIYVKLMGASTKMVGIINSVFFLTAGLLSFPMGFLSDRLGRKVITSAGLVLVSVTSFALYFASSPLQVMVIYFLFGIGLSAYGPTMMSLVADIASPSYMGWAYGWYTTSLYLGMSAGPAIGGWIAEKLGYGTVFISSGVLTFLLLIAMVLGVPNRVKMKKPGSCNTPNILRVGSGREGKLLNSALAGSWIITWGGCFSLGMFVTFIPLHAYDSGIAIGKIGYIFFLQGLTNAISRAPFGWLSDRVSDRGAFAAAGIITAAVAMVGFAESHRLFHFLASAVLLGCGMATAFPSIGAIIANVTPPSFMGIAMGGYNTAIYFGIMSASLIMGPIVEEWGYGVAFETSAVITFLAVFAFVLMMRRYRKIRSRS